MTLLDSGDLEFKEPGTSEAAASQFVLYFILESTSPVVWYAAFAVTAPPHDCESPYPEREAAILIL